MEEQFVPEETQNHEQTTAQPSEEAPVEVDWNKRYNDLRPVYDKTMSENSRLKQEMQEIRLKTLEAQQQVQQANHVQPKQEPITEDSFFSAEAKSIQKDFPDIFKGVKEHINFAMKQKTLQEHDEFQKIQQEAVTAKQEAENARLEIEQIRVDSQLASALGGHVWPAVDSYQPFRDWVSADRMRMWQMQMGETSHKIDCVNGFLATPEGQQFSGTMPPQTTVRRQEVQGIMGRQVPTQPQAGRNNWDNMSDQERWDSIPDYEVN